MKHFNTADKSDLLVHARAIPQPPFFIASGMLLGRILCAKK
jgi:hypothetical protein